MSQENRSLKKKRRHDIQQIILGTVAAAGLLSVTLVAPNAILALKSLGLTPKKRQLEIINAARNRLLTNGLLVRDTNGHLKLSKKGELKMAQVESVNFQLRKPKRWDTKWRVLIFDIHEKQKSLREKIRRTLVSVGFVRLQHSVWVYPHPCEDFIALFKTNFRIGNSLLYLIVDSIENDRALLHHYKLVPTLSLAAAKDNVGRYVSFF
jgi:DNA-binding transcriptional regulator PaaX